MLNRYLQRRRGNATWGLAIALAVLCGTLPPDSVGQSAPPPRPYGSVSIHQAQVALIGRDAVGGRTHHYQGRFYPFKLGGGIGDQF